MSAGAGELLQLLRDGRPRTRSELVAETGLARTSIVNRLSALMAAGFVVEEGNAASSGGRPAARVVFDQSSWRCLGIAFGVTHASIGLLDMSGNVRSSMHHAIDIGDGPEPVLGWALEQCEELLRGEGVQPDRILGIGIGVPGPVEHTTGRPIRPPIMPGWDGFDIPAYVSQRISAPVFVDNDVNILAIGERTFSYPEVDDLLFIKVSTGIGAGIILGGQIQRGAEGSAGDLGHVLVPGMPTDKALEARASASALAQTITAKSKNPVTANTVVNLIRDGDPIAMAAAREAGRTIGEVTASCVSLLNPAVVVIGGRLGIHVQEIIAGVREVVYRRSIPLATQHLHIVAAQADSMVDIRGAALMVTDATLNAIAVDSWLTQHTSRA